MHFEINADAAQVAAVAQRLGAAAVQIVDYSGGYPGAGAVAAKGYGGAMRYLPKEGGSKIKPLTPGELRDYWDHGLDVGLIGEHRDPARPLQGAAAGLHDAQYFLAQARAITVAAGRPAGSVRAIYLACDVDTIAGNRPAAGEYYDAAQMILGDLTGVYGEYDLIEYLVQRGIGRWFWQTFAWSIGHNLDTQWRHPAAHLFQRRQTVQVNGVDCDVNDVLKTDFGQYAAGNNPTGGDFLMALTSQEQAAMRDQVAYMAQGKSGAWPQGGQALYESEQFDAILTALADLTEKVNTLLPADPPPSTGL